MADAAVEFLLNNLKDLLVYHAHLIKDTKKEIESLESHLRVFNGLLKDSLNQRRKNELTKVQDQNIREVVYEVEDVIDAFVARIIEKKSTSRLKFWKFTSNLHTIGQKIEEVKEKVEQAKSMFNFKVSDEDHKPGTPKDPLPRHTDVVGFEDVTAKLIHRLTTKTDYFDVVCLIGAFGMGKTTLADKVFNDPEIKTMFPVRIWHHNTEELSNKEIFLDILQQLTTVTDDVRNKKDQEIARIIFESLKDKSFLIVTDDVWTHGDWDRLKYALPTANYKGKVLITSRTQAVGKYACSPRLPHLLRPFNPEESWKLLELEVLKKPECPPRLATVGQQIAKGCEGLPLAIQIVGRILATEYSPSDLIATEKAWKEVSTKVSACLNADPEMNRSISLSFDKLPSHLRACFLYLGMFPRGYEIPASILILMWIGEGFIQLGKDCSSLEETGEQYLEYLINVSLVAVQTVKTNGKVKTCKIHEVVRDFCRTKAETENFFQDIKSMNNVFVPPVHDLEKYRRLSIHSNCLKFIKSKPSARRVRSFVCYSKDDCILQTENTRDILKAFKLVRVFNAKPIKFPKVNSDMFQLVHVRYIALSFSLSTLPSKFSQLLNLQTLIVDTTAKTLEVEADIWKLIQLRLFKTNVSATLPKPSKDSKFVEELQTLGIISVESCTDELQTRASNLKKLGIRGDLSLLLEGNEGSWNSLGRMKNLEHLKLINDLHPDPLLNPKLALPKLYQFPSRLKSLTLRATSLDWSDMSTLGSLENLEVLKLKDKAFMGEVWEAPNGGFRLLEFLHIEDTDLAVWKASSDHYPSLRGLVLGKCEKLREVPIGVANIESFQALQLKSCKSAVTSATKIEEQKKKSLAPFSLIMDD